MNKKLSLFCIALISLVVSSVHAQKIKPETVASTIPSHPFIPLPDSFTTYQVGFDNQGLDLKDYKDITNPVDKIRLEKFKLVTDLADLNIVVKIGSPVFFRSFSDVRINSIDELKGMSSEAMLDYYVPSSYEITDKRGVLIRREFQDDVAGSYSDLPTNPTRLQTKASEVLKNVSSHVNARIMAINENIRNLVDVYRKSHPMDFYVIKPSKTETYSEFSEAVKNLDEAFKKSSSDEVMLDKALHVAIDFWESKIKQFDPATEDGKPYYFLCSYNLSLAYCFLGDFSKVDEYLEKTKAADFKSGYASMIAYDIGRIKKKNAEYDTEKEKVAKNPEYIYQSGTIEYATNNIFGKTKKTEVSNFTEKGFVILINGDTLFGKFIEFDLNLAAGKILFLENGKPKVEYKEPYPSLQKFSLRGSIFYYIGALRKVTYSSSQLVVLTNKAEVYFLFISQSKGSAYPRYEADDMASFATNYRKNMAEAFKDVCKFVVDKALRGEYDLRKEDTKPLEQIIKDYETQCGSKEYDQNAALLKEDRIQSLYK